MITFRPLNLVNTRPQIILMQRNFYMIAIGFVSLLLLQGCSNAIVNSFESKPTALGTTNEIVVIADQEVWDGSLGDTIRFYYGAPYPIMPQPEPIFDLRHFTPTQLSNDVLRRELRTYLIVADLTDADSETTGLIREDLGAENLKRAESDSEYFSSVGHDKWARGQLLIYVFGNGQEQLADRLIRSFPSVASRVNQHDLVQIDAATYLDGENMQINDLISEKYDIFMKVPGDFNVAIDQDNFLWLRRDDGEQTASILLTARAYRSENQFSKEALIDLRDTLGRRIQTSMRGTYTRTNAEDLPVYVYDKKVSGNYTLEGRGIWEMVGEFMGGPFVTYMILKPDQTSILIADVFLYAPGKDKRNLIQQLDHVVQSIQFKG